MVELIFIQKFLIALLGSAWLYGGAMLYLRGRNKLASGKRGNKKDINDFLGEDGIQISKNYTLSEKQCNGHVDIIAPTRAGKTTSIFIPNLLQDKIRGSIIAPDPKEEIYEKTHKYQKLIGRKVIQYKPLDKSFQYNPLLECRNETEVKQLGQNILINGALSFELQTGKKAQGIEWLVMTSNLLIAALLHVYPKGTIREAVELILLNDDKELDKLFMNSKKSALLHYSLFKTAQQSEGTIGSIKSTFASYVSLFIDDNLAINKSDFTFDNLRSKETIIYISYPENKSIYLSPLMSCIYSQVIDHLIDDYKKESLPIWFLADEFGNIGQLSNFAVNISTAGSRHINFILCLQSKNQLKRLYGENAETILGNCATTIVLPGLKEVDTLRWITDLCGFKEIQITENKLTHKSKTQLFDMSEIRRIDTGKELILISNRQPIIDEQNIYYNQEKYLNNVF